MVRDHAAGSPHGPTASPPSCSRTGRTCPALPSGVYVFVEGAQNHKVTRNIRLFHDNEVICREEQVVQREHRYGRELNAGHGVLQLLRYLLLEDLSYLDLQVIVVALAWTGGMQIGRRDRHVRRRA